jgi:hypothetical protein
VLASNASELRPTKNATLKDTEYVLQIPMHVKTKYVSMVERNTSSNNANKRRPVTTTSSKTQEPHGFQPNVTEAAPTMYADAAATDTCATLPSDLALLLLNATSKRLMFLLSWIHQAP